MNQVSANDVPDEVRWNHNIQYHNLLLRHLPANLENVLDVGCGDGMLVRKLASRAKHVVGIDLDAGSIHEAKRLSLASNVEFVRGDALTHSFPTASFDAVLSIATIHHLNMAEALRRFASLLRPGGALGVIGIPRPQLVREFPWQLAGAITTRLHRMTKTYWEHSAPTCWPPPLTTSQARSIAQEELRGCRFRRHVLWRYSILWYKPQ